MWKVSIFHLLIYSLTLTFCEEISMNQKLKRFEKDREILTRKEKKVFLGSEINLNQDEQFA